MSKQSNIYNPAIMNTKQIPKKKPQQDVYMMASVMKQ